LQTHVTAFRPRRSVYCSATRKVELKLRCFSGTDNRKQYAGGTPLQVLG
jgi:hypothetical protein